MEDNLKRGRHKMVCQEQRKRLEKRINQYMICLVLAVLFILPATTAHGVGKPPQPFNLRVNTPSLTQLQVAWDCNTSSDNEPEGFYIERRRKNEPNFIRIATIGNVRYYNDTGVPSNECYYYRVKSFNAAGESSFSSEKSGCTWLQYTPPAAPTDFKAINITPYQFDLVWKDNSNNEKEFEIAISRSTVSGASIIKVPANTASYTVNTYPETQHWMSIQAFSQGGVSQIAKAECTTPPLPPKNLEATAQGPDKIGLAWINQSKYAKTLIVECRKPGENFIQIAKLVNGETAYTQTGLKDNVTYAYRVKAGNYSTESDYSNIVTAKTPEIIPPSNLTAVPVYSVKIHLAWNDNANNESGYIIERMTQGVFYLQIASLPANSSEYNDDQLAPYKQYTYRVKAAGTDKYSNPATAVTLKPQKPNPPSDLKLAAQWVDKNILQWKDNSNNETAFEIEQKTHGGSFGRIGTVGTNVTTFTHKLLGPPQTYCYRVRALDANEASAYSKEACTTSKSSTSAQLGAPSQDVIPQPPTLILPDITSVKGVQIGKGVLSQWGGTIHVTDADAISCIKGKCAFDVSYDMINSSAAPTDLFTNRIYAGNTVISNQGGLSLEASESRQIMTQVYLAVGKNVLTLKLDDDKKISEANEGNNQFTITVVLEMKSVKPKPAPLFKTPLNLKPTGQK